MNAEKLSNGGCGASSGQEYIHACSFDIRSRRFDTCACSFDLPACPSNILRGQCLWNLGIGMDSSLSKELAVSHDSHAILACRVDQGRYTRSFTCLKGRSF